MKPRITVITLGVDDLERALRFYRDGLELPTKGIVGQEFEHGAVVFFDLENGSTLALWPRESIAHDSGLPRSAPSPTDLTLGHNVSSRSEVDAVMERARAAGATVVKPAHETFWGGYAGYFQDPDRHVWEVAWNPQMPVDGSAKLRTAEAVRAACVEALRSAYEDAGLQGLCDEGRWEAALGAVQALDLLSIVRSSSAPAQEGRD